MEEYFSILAKEWEESAELPEHCSDIRRAVVRIGMLYDYLNYKYAYAHNTLVIYYRTIHMYAIKD